MAKEKIKEPEYIGGGLKVTLTKEWTEYGVTRPAGTELTVSRDGFKMLKESGFLDISPEPVILSEAKDIKIKN